MAQVRANRSRRVWLPAAAFTLFALFAVARLIQVQVLRHDHYVATANAELRANEVIFGRRGAILDRNGNVLATSVDTWDIYVSASLWDDPRLALEASSGLAQALKLDAAQLRASVAEKATGDLLIARDVDYEVGRKLLQRRLDGVVALPNNVRINPNGDVGSALIGLTGEDNTGLSGLEAFLNDTLLGTPGRAVYERDTTGAPIPFGQFITAVPTPGSDVITTIDRYLQRLAEIQLRDAIEKSGAKGGSIIIMDPHTGDILALASEPSFRFSQLPITDPAQIALLKNFAVTELYQPGSVMKSLTTAAAIDAGVVSPYTTYYDIGYWKEYDVIIKNWNDESWAEQTMTGVLQHSINTGAIFMANLLGPKRLGEYQAAFGLGEPTGIELPGEAAGFYNHPGDVNWSIADFWTQSFGQGINVTVPQMAAAFSAVINGGELLRPRMVKGYVGESGVVSDVPREVVSRPISAEASATMRQMLFDVVEPPDFGHPAKSKIYTVGGKSGTADIEATDGRPSGGIIVSFAGFAPVEAPRVVIYVKLDEPKSEEATGARTAAPVFGILMDATLRYLNVAPSSERLALR